MRKEDYIIELTSRLNGLTQEESDDAISYCTEYFDDAGEGNEEQVIEDLGMPAKFAAQMKANSVIRDNQNKSSKGKKQEKSSVKNIVVIILGICALPIALPLLFALMVVVFALFVTLGALLFAGIVTVIAVLFSGIPLVVNGFMNFSTPENALIAIGGGLLCVGIGMFLLLFLYHLIKTIIPAFTRAVTRLYHRALEGKKHEKA